MHTSVNIANLQKMLTKINKSGAITKIRILLKSEIVKYLKTFRIISNGILFSIHILY